jgi:stearoyl-CoA desaturase (delta-9 desaturase)
MSKPKIIWTNVILFTITGLVGVIGVPVYGYFYGYDIYHLIATVLCIGYCGMSITAGYHRLWSHHAYQANPVIRFIYALGGAFALQNSALHWSSDHRIHHRHVDDNDRDPYSAKRGFFYSHIGWMLREYQRERYEDYSNVPDLQRDKIVMWQHKHYLTLAILTNFGIPLAIGLIHGDVWGMLLTVGVLRLVISHHVTFFINSLAHIWGRQPYSDGNTARDNGLIAYFTFGEGYHNYHHCFQFDYRNGIRWWQFDPTKWLIWTLDKIGLAHNLRRCGNDRIEKAKAEMSLKKATASLHTLPNAEEVKAKLQAEYDALVEKINEAYAAQKAWVELKKDTLKKSYEHEKAEAMKQYKELKISLQEQRDRWQSLVAQYA